MQVEFHHLESVPEQLLRYAVIVSRFQGQWVFARHRERDTWEIPGGKRDAGEEIGRTAARELREETGARLFSLQAMCEYSVARAGQSPSFGRLYLAEVEEFAPLEPSSEIAQISLFAALPDRLTYPQIQTYLFQRVQAAATTVEK